MFIETHRSQIHSIKQGDRHFMIEDGLMMAQRAGIEISDDCPSAWKEVIVKAYNNGYVKPFANITEREMLFLGMTK
jgi:hypothetical protein